MNTMKSGDNIDADKLIEALNTSTWVREKFLLLFPDVLISLSSITFNIQSKVMEGYEKTREKLFGSNRYKLI